MRRMWNQYDRDICTWWRNSKEESAGWVSPAPHHLSVFLGAECQHLPPWQVDCQLSLYVLCIVQSFALFSLASIGVLNERPRKR